MQHTYYLLIALGLLLITTTVRSDTGSDEETFDESDVVVLNQDNFDEVISGNEYVFVEFYAPWCGHCKRLAPEWAKLATKVKTNQLPVVVAKLDATTSEEIGAKHAARGYPTIRFFRSGNPTDYEGGRSLDDLYTYIVKKSGPASKHLRTQEEIDEFVSDGKATKVVGYFTGEESDKSYETFVKVASSLDDFQFGHVTDSSLYGENKADNVVVHNDGEKYPFTESLTKTKLSKFIETEGYPLVDELAAKIWQRSSSGPTPLIAVFVDTTEDPEVTSFVKSVAKKFKGKVLFSQSNVASLAERWGASGKVLPTAIFVNWVNSEPKMSIYDEEGSKLSENTLEDFLNQALEGKYKSYMKSEPIPEKNDEPVTIVVGKNFDAVVNDKTKDVFVEFYAPWCGHCKKLTPIWDELGGEFVDNKNVVIAKMDATTNTPPSNIEIKGFPTLIFFPADNKEGVPYTGERELDSLVKFVKEQSSHNVEGKVDL